MSCFVCLKYHVSIYKIYNYYKISLLFNLSKIVFAREIAHLRTIYDLTSLRFFRCFCYFIIYFCDLLFNTNGGVLSMWMRNEKLIKITMWIMAIFLLFVYLFVSLHINVVSMSFMQCWIGKHSLLCLYAWNPFVIMLHKSGMSCLITVEGKHLCGSLKI